MKSATITWITYNNYGTELQAYALQKYLGKIGIDNDIISDYDVINKIFEKTGIEGREATQPICILRKTARLIKKYFIHPVKLFRVIMSFAGNEYSHKKARMFLGKNNKQFDIFRKKNLRICYSYNRKNLQDMNQEYDLFICGSDQIWSFFDNNYDGYYYLDFVKKKKVSYATSIGTDVIPDEMEKRIAEWLGDYSAISVREASTAKILSDIVSKQVAWVCDPTLLFDGEFWGKMDSFPQKRRRKYLLCYFLSNNSWYFDYAKAMAKHLQLNIILLPSRLEYSRIEGCCKEGVGPVEFVSYIKNAEFILTDSYHGSLFSLQFNKSFLYLKRFLDSDPLCQNNRIYSLFERLKIQNVIISQKQFSPCDIVEIPYQSVNESLSEFREYSRNFLRDAVNL